MEHLGIKPKNHDLEVCGIPFCRWKDIVTKQLSYDGNRYITYNQTSGHWEYTTDNGATRHKITGQEATLTDSGLMSAADKTKIDGIESSATADQTPAEIATAYSTQVPAATQTEMETGTETGIRRMSPQGVKQSVLANTPGGGDMLKSQYDPDNDGQVETADTADYATNAGQLNSQPASYYRNASNLNTGSLPRARLGELYRDNTSGNTASPYIQTGLDSIAKTPGTTITFATAFTETPRVLLGTMHIYAGNQVFIDLITTTGFTAHTTYQTANQDINWAAIGKKT